jgi:chromosome segregation ATPase
MTPMAGSAPVNGGYFPIQQNLQGANQMTTFDDVVNALKNYEDSQIKQQTELRRQLSGLDRLRASDQQAITGLRSIEASLQADLADKRGIIQAQSERIIEIAAYRDELKAENAELKKRRETDERVVKRNLEMVDEIADLKTRNEALERRCAALDHRVAVQKDEIDHLKFAMHKAGL